MKVIDKDTDKEIGVLSSIDEVKDLGKKHLLEPFMRYGFIVYKDQDNNFGVISAKKCVLREAIQ